jgi:nucleoside-triphosphatase THEP1
MQIAFIHARQRGDADDTLRDVAGDLRRRGYRLSGVLPAARTRVARHACDMDLIDLASGARFPISQNLGAGSTGCRLDAAAIEAAAVAVGAGLATTTCDVLILNRFGKLEAKGRGFHDVIVSTLARGIPVLVGVNDLNRPVFQRFAAGMAIEMPDAACAVLDWLLPTLQKDAA